MNQSLSGIPSIYFCGHEHCQPGHSFGPAVRPHYLIHVVLSGKGIFKHQGHTYSLKSGDSFLIKPMDSTYYEADQTNPWEYAWIGFNGQEIPALLNQTCFQDSCIFICPPDSERKLNLRTLMHSILNTFSSANYNPFTLTGLFLELLGLMTGPSVVEGNSYSTQYVKRAMDYMKNNYGYNIRIQDIAAAIDTIKKEFKSNWNGCTLTEIYYAGDDSSKDHQDWADRNNADEVIVLLSSFDIDSSGGDGSLNPNSTYNDWKWILVRTNGGQWQHVDHGY